MQQLLESDLYDQVKALVRRPVDRDHPKLEQIVYDYDDPDPEAIQADHVYCCLGTTMKKAGSKEAFRKVDHDYPLKLARMAYQNGAGKFALVSAVGANSGSMFYYNRVKGQLEEDIREIPFQVTCILRPSMLLGPRAERRIGEELGKAVMKPLRFLFPSNMKPVHVSQVAACMVDHMNRDEQGVHVIPSGRMLDYPVVHQART